MRINIDQDDFGALCVCAIRYCQGRQTYMPSLIQRVCREHLKELSDRDLHVMIQDCERQRKVELYGDPVIDKPDWIKWEADLLEEQKRRNTKKK